MINYKHWKGDLENSVLKLNIDGAFKANFVGLRGIIRDGRGNIVIVVGFYVATNSPLNAELMDAHHILAWCYNRGFTYLRVKTDSLLLNKMVQGKKANWLSYNMVAKVHSLLKDSRLELIPIWLEQNQGVPYVRG
ncbi:hypothetical protein LIER_41177 [Lithospermum erythrorhizon]|uniref:RNase H type-1 domain-containing protein n=1 Tax=Lithospermum erythrorhizon TaxID=34254 RepID=A0AAV3R5D6_LITER